MRTVSGTRSVRLLAVAACITAGVALTACGSSSSGGGKKTNGGPTGLPTEQPTAQARDGLIQARDLSGDGARKILVVKPDGAVVRTVTLPFEPAIPRAVAPDKVLYTSGERSVALVDGSNGSVKLITTPGDDYSLSTYQPVDGGPNSPRYVLLAPAQLNGALLLDVQTGQTTDLASVLGSKGDAEGLAVSPDGNRVLVTDFGGVALFSPTQPKDVHRFAKYSLGACFTSDGKAVVAEPTGKSRYRVIAFDPGSNQTRTVKDSVGPAPHIACVGTNVAVATGDTVEFDPVNGGEPASLPALSADVNRLVGVGDGRHLLVATGEDGRLHWSYADASRAQFTALPALDGQLPTGGAPGQRYWLFSPDPGAPSGSGRSHNVYGLDTANGALHPAALPAPALPGSGAATSADGRWRAVPTLGVTAPFALVDLQTGAVTSSLRGLLPSPSGDRLLSSDPRNHQVFITDLQLKKLHTISPAATAVWSVAS